MVRLPAGIRPTDDDLQSLRALGGTWCLGAAVSRTRCAGPIDRDADDRLHARQSAPLGLGRKKGEQTQAIGRSRGGRNTKIHAIADAKGRLLYLLLTGGEAHDCPPAQRLIRRAKAARKMLGDKAYDSADCDNGSASAAPNPSFPTNPTASSPSASTGNPTSSATASRTPSAASKTSDASQRGVLSPEPPSSTTGRATANPLIWLCRLCFGLTNPSAVRAFPQD